MIRLNFVFGFVVFVAGLMFSPTVFAEQVSTTELGRQVRKQLILHANAESAEAKDDAVAALCDLYVVMRSDSRFASSSMLRGDANKVRRRLLSVAKTRERELRRGKVARPSNLTRLVDNAIDDAISSSQDDSSSEESAAGSASAFGNAAGGLVVNSGWSLVELIKRIIDPDFWDSRGGNGSIQYFAMRRVLVVRATSDVHQQIKDLLTALR